MKNLLQNLLTFIGIFFIQYALYAQENLVVNGTIKDKSTQESLVGATVSIKNTSIGTISDSEGNFSLKTSAKLPLVLEIRYMGYENQEIVVENKNFLTILLNSTTDVLLELIVTSRRKEESVQEVPIPIAVLGASQLNNSVAFNVNRVKELLPSVQLYSSNPRNTGISIRGLGSTFGLTNDGIDPGVGFYVDGVYFARTAATTIDFIDIEQIEVLRGVQGTLFGKNTTAGAFNITTKRPSFQPNVNYENSFGNFGFVQAKASVTGAIFKDKVAARLSFTGTNRDGLLYNVATQKNVNTLNNLGFKGQILYIPNDKVEFLLSLDNTRQRPDGYAQVFAGVAPTLRPAYRQFDQIIADLNYKLPSRNPFDRLIDHDTPWKSGQDMGGVSLNTTLKLGSGKLTSITAWRYWNWDPSNDRDFTGLQALALSQAPSIQEQWSQELRYSGNFGSKLSGTLGVFAFYQSLDPNGAHTEESGKDQWRFSQSSNSALWKTPFLLEGFGIKSYPRLKNFSGAFFGQTDWKISEKFTLVSGIRFNYDQKEVDFSRVPYGGLQTKDPALLAIKNGIYSGQAFKTDIDNFNISGQLTSSYKFAQKVRAFATYALSYKPVGLNLGGLPRANGQDMVELAAIKPEQVQHFELGIKTEPIEGASLNLTLYNTQIKDYQTLVQTPDIAVNRGYLANAEKVRVIGAEIEGNLQLKNFSLNGAVSYTDGKYISFTNAPPPLEETGGATFKDISGGQLPGISKWAATLNADAFVKRKFWGQESDFFVGADVFYRSSFSSSPSPSKYLNIDGYALLNLRLGFRAKQGISIFVWGRNVLDTNYFEQLLPAGGNAGHYAAVLGDQRSYGITLRYNLR